MIRLNWKWCWFVGVCLAIVCLGGCAQIASAMKSLFGYDANGNVDPNSIGAMAATYANYVLPGSGIVITALAGLFGHATVKNRKQKKVINSTFDAIEEHGDPDLKAKLKVKHGTAGVLPFVQKQVKKYPKKPPPDIPTAA